MLCFAHDVCRTFQTRPDSNGRILSPEEGLLRDIAVTHDVRRRFQTRLDSKGTYFLCREQNALCSHSELAYGILIPERSHSDRMSSSPSVCCRFHRLHEHPCVDRDKAWCVWGGKSDSKQTSEGVNVSERHKERASVYVTWQSLKRDRHCHFQCVCACRNVLQRLAVCCIAVLSVYVRVAVCCRLLQCAADIAIGLFAAIYIYTHAHTRTRIWRSWLYMYMHTCVHTNTHTHTHTHIHTCTHTHVHTRTHTLSSNLLNLSEM